MRLSRMLPLMVTCCGFLLALPAFASAAGITISCEPASCKAEAGTAVTLTAVMDKSLAAADKFVWDLDGDGKFETEAPQNPATSTHVQAMDNKNTGAFKVGVKALDSGAKEIGTGEVDVTISAGVSAKVEEATPGKPQDGNKINPDLNDPKGDIDALRIDIGQDGSYEYYLPPGADLNIPPAPGDRQVVVDGLGIDGAVVDTTTILVPGIQIDGCNPFASLGYIELRGGCAQLSDGGRRLTVTGTNLWMLGLPFRLEPPAGQSTGALIFDARTGTMTTRGNLVIVLNGTSVAPEVVLWRGALTGTSAWSIPGLAGFINRIPRQAPETPVTLASFGVGDGCRPSERTRCAVLPGGVVASGDIGIRVSRARGLYADGLVSFPGGLLRLSMRVDPDSGLVIDELRGRALALPLDVANTPRNADDDYILTNANISYDPLPDDRWEISGRVGLPWPGRPAVQAQATIVRGEIETASLRLTAGEYRWGESLRVTDLALEAAGRRASGTVSGIFGNSQLVINASLNAILDLGRSPALLTGSGTANLQTQSGRRVVVQMPSARFAADINGNARVAAGFNGSIDVSDIWWISGDSLGFNGSINGWVSPPIAPSTQTRFGMNGLVFTGAGIIPSIFMRVTESGARACALTLGGVLIELNAQFQYVDWHWGCNMPPLLEPQALPELRSRRGVGAKATNQITVPRSAKRLSATFELPLTATSQVIKRAGKSSIDIPAPGSAPVQSGGVTIGRAPDGEVTVGVTKPSAGLWTLPRSGSKLRVSVDSGNTTPTPRILATSAQAVSVRVDSPDSAPSNQRWEVHELMDGFDRVVATGAGDKTISVIPSVGPVKRKLSVVRTIGKARFAEQAKSVSFSVPKFKLEAPTVTQLRRVNRSTVSARWTKQPGVSEWLVTVRDSTGARDVYLVRKPTGRFRATGNTSVIVRARGTDGKLGKRSPQKVLR